MTPTELFENAMDWLREYYWEHRFFAERDIVWTVQKQMLQVVEAVGVPFHVVNDYTMFDRIRADLVVLNSGAVEVAVEFKYEPSHARSTERKGDIWQSKFNPDIVFWTVPASSRDGSVEKDILRTRQYVEERKANVAYSVFIDEGGNFSHRDPPLGSEWHDWGEGKWVLWSQAGPLSS